MTEKLKNRKAKQSSIPMGAELPLKPLALMNVKQIDNELAKMIGHFWAYIWKPKNPAIDPKTRFLLSLANAVGAGRYRQATRELLKAYAVGVSRAELDEVFALFVWNQGVGTFASEIGPSPLFGAYTLIKKLEQKGLRREEVTKKLVEKFGEKNPDVGVITKAKNYVLATNK